MSHILIYSDDPGFGGVAQCNHAIALALRKQGFHVSAAQRQNSTPLLEQQRQQGIQHHWTTWDVTDGFIHTLQDASDAQQIFQAVQPDLILFSQCCPFSCFAAKRTALAWGIPFMVIEGFVSEVDCLPPLLDELGQHYAAARAVISVSHQNLQLLRRVFRLPDDRGQVIHNGRADIFFTPPDRAVRQKIRRQHDIPETAMLCFTAARLADVKGYGLQLEAIYHLKSTPFWPPLYFLWAGTGPEEAMLRQTVLEWGIADRVQFLGQVWNIPDYLDASDCFVLPSFCEGMPLCVMEAMAKGLAVMASAVSGIPEELGETGQLLPDPNQDVVATVQAIVDTLIAWSQSPHLRTTIGLAGQQRARSLFREERMVNEYLQVIQQILAPSS